MEKTETVTVTSSAGLSTGWGGPKYSRRMWLMFVAGLGGGSALLIVMIALDANVALNIGMLAMMIVGVFGVIVSINTVTPNTVRAEVAPGTVRFGPNQRLRYVLIALAVVGLINVLLYGLVLQSPAAEVRRFGGWLPANLGFIALGIWAGIRGIRKPNVTLDTIGVTVEVNGKPIKARWREIADASIVVDRVVITTRDGRTGNWFCTQLQADPIIVSTLINRYAKKKYPPSEIGQATLDRVAEGTWR